MTALLIGAGLGAVLIGMLYSLGALEDRSGIAVLLGAIALFWPVFAFQAEAGTGTIILHCTVFLAFSALAAYGFKTSATLLAAGIIAQGRLTSQPCSQAIQARSGGPPCAADLTSSRALCSCF